MSGAIDFILNKDCLTFVYMKNEHARAFLLIRTGSEVYADPPAWNFPVQACDSNYITLKQIQIIDTLVAKFRKAYNLTPQHDTFKTPGSFSKPLQFGDTWKYLCSGRVGCRAKLWQVALGDIDVPFALQVWHCTFFFLRSGRQRTKARSLPSDIQMQKNANSKC